jgi:uncharacterized protein (DUF305 family)
MNSGKLISVMTAGLLLVSLAGCSSANRGTTNSAERTSGSAMVRENTTKPGAGGMGQGGNLGSGTETVDEKLRSCNDLVTQQLSNADQNYDQRFLDILISQKESQLKVVKDGQNNAKNANLKAMAKELANSDQKELDHLKTIRKDSFKDEGPTATNR